MSEIQFGERYRLKAGVTENLDKKLIPIEFMGNNRGFVRYRYVGEDGEIGSSTVEWFNVHYELDDQHAPDPVNHPAHYTSGSVECIDAIRAALTPDEFRGFVKGNAIKYCWRERRKGGDEDLRKAGWYLTKVTKVSE